MRICEYSCMRSSDPLPTLLWCAAALLLLMMSSWRHDRDVTTMTLLFMSSDKSAVTGILWPVLKVVWKSWGAPSRHLPLSLTHSLSLPPHSTWAGGRGWAKSWGLSPSPSSPPPLNLSPDCDLLQWDILRFTCSVFETLWHMCSMVSCASSLLGSWTRYVDRVTTCCEEIALFTNDVVFHHGRAAFELNGRSLEESLLPFLSTTCCRQLLRTNTYTDIHTCRERVARALTEL